MRLCALYDIGFEMNLGKISAKWHLPVANRREVAVFGVARLQGSPEAIMKAFQESMA
jgi:hypothetical protein